MDSKVVLITGCSSGIGVGIAVHLASLGYRRLAIVARRRDRLEATAAKCLEAGGKDVEVLVLVKDLTVEEECRAAVEETVKHFGSECVFVCLFVCSVLETS